MLKKENIVCACTQKLLDIRLAAQSAKKASLIKLTCADCGKVYWSNAEKKYCYNCEPKHVKMKGGSG